MSIFSHKDLDVWQKAMDMVVHIYTLTKKFPREEIYGLTSQMRRAAVSIPSNIAEGRSKRTTRDFLRFISIASGSAAELETQIMIGNRLGYFGEKAFDQLFSELESVGRMLNKLYMSLEKKASSPSPESPVPSPEQKTDIL